MSKMFVSWILPGQDRPAATTAFDPDEDWSWQWLEHMMDVKGREGLNFFFTVETTDVMEELGLSDSPLLNTPEDWCSILGAKILDPDGWRTPGSDWYKPITQEEFDRRLAQCTIDGRGYPAFVVPPEQQRCSTKDDEGRRCFRYGSHVHVPHNFESIEEN